MSNTPLEDQVHDALHRRVDSIQHAPLTVTDVRHRARRIQRRRTAVAGVAVAAVLAIAIPFGLSATGSGQRSDVPPATQPPSPTPTLQLGSTVMVDPRGAEVVEETPVPLLDVDAPSLITPDGTTDLPHVYDTITPYLDGYVGVALNDQPGVPPVAIEFLGADLRVDDGGSPTGGLIVSPDGRRIGWSEYDGTRWRVFVADPAGQVEWVETTFPPSAETETVIPVGFVSDEAVAVRAMYDLGDTKTFVAGGGQPVEVQGLLQADAASPSLGVVAGITEFRPQGTCFGVVDAIARDGDPVWTTCDHRLGPFSAGGAYVVGISAEADGNGSPTITVLDAATGKEVVTFEAVLPRRTVGGFWTQMAWVGDEALVVRMFSGDDYFMMRLGLDGSVQRIGIPSAGVSGLQVAVPS
ncbi:hypothetical protein [Nocardioides zhouii]|uniref:WD40 repeat domain-containing protein n=1 Tax=Nocardioides zhouii TaxID=1168729 RepID=A0A4V1RQD8_9ACTN|nr:hypothetical protein [Nocardioides zhouii]RYC12507.1 hypothetical protein EUA94_07495 [Nocardioides zhouii]